MKELTITHANAKKAFNKADAKGKELLTDLLGKDFFNQKITDRIKTWEDAAEHQGLDPVDSLPFSEPENSFETATNAFFKLDVIATVLNEGTILDWTNDQQQKWYPWFNNYKPGSGFSFDATNCGWAYTGTCTSGGARLCVHSSELAKYFGTQFLSILNDFLNPIK